jgi:D-3-phosphoglycerate dehydrogenase
MSDVTIAISEGSIGNPLWASVPAEKHGITLKYGPVETVEDVVATTAGCDALVVSLHKMTPEKIAALPSTVKCLSRLGVGLDSINLVAAKEHKLSVIFQPLYAFNEVANHAAAMMLALHRGVVQATLTTRAGEWKPAIQIAEIASSQDSTLGVIGCGRIGRNFIQKMAPFFNNVLGYDPAVKDEIPGVTMVDDLDVLLKESKFISMHAPYLPSTHHMIGKRELGIMQKGSILVNVSRGGLIDEAALVEALESGHLDGAGLDVFEQEPLPLDSILRSTKNLLLSPHIAWYSQSSGPRLVDWGITDAYTFITQQKIEHGSFATGPF